MIKTMRHSGVFHFALVVWAAFIPAMMLLDRADLFAVTGALTFCAAVAVLHAYWPAMKIALNHDKTEFEYVDFLTLGIMCSWFSIAARMVYVLYLRQSLSVPEEYSSYFLAFLQYVNFTGAILHLSARRVIKNHIPTTSVPRVVLATVVGLVLGTVLSLLN